MLTELTLWIPFALVFIAMIAIGAFMLGRDFLIGASIGTAIAVILLSTIIFFMGA